MLKSTDQFTQKIQEIIDDDYGDFMRKAHGYFLVFKTELGTHLSADIRLKLAEMENYIQFTPNWQVEPTRKRILNDIKGIEDAIRFTQPLSYASL